MEQTLNMCQNKISIFQKIINIAPLVAPIVIIIVILDQWSKIFIEGAIDFLEIIPIIDGFFNITLNYNKGAAFGIFSGLPSGIRQLTLGGISVVAFFVIIYLIIFEYYSCTIGKVALAMIMGGAIGNGIDRIYRGEVVDFLDFYIGTYHWPTFNLADSAITVGAAILIFLTLFNKNPDHKDS